jgi:hypothetical protein
LPPTVEEEEEEERARGAGCRSRTPAPRGPCVRFENYSGRAVVGSERARRSSNSSVSLLSETAPPLVKERALASRMPCGRRTVGSGWTRRVSAAELADGVVERLGRLKLAHVTSAGDHDELRVQDSPNQAT